jgi:hypothetical protein
MSKKIDKRDIIQGNFVGRRQVDQWCCPMVESFLPPGCTEAPSVSRLQSSKSGHWHGGREIIAMAFGEGEKLLGNLDADTVDAVVVNRDFAASVTGKTGHWFYTADFQRGTENVFIFRHNFFL